MKPPNIESWRESAKQIRAAVRAETMREVTFHINEAIARYNRLAEHDRSIGRGVAAFTGAVVALEELKEELGL